MQFLRTIKSWWGLGNNAWSGPTGLDQDLVHVDNHLPNITFAGPIAAGTASAAAPGAAPGVAQLFVDGSYAVTNRDAAGNMAVTAYSPRQGALASNGGDIFICTGASWQSQSAQFERLDQSNKQPGQQQTGYNVQVRETNGIADIFFSDPSGTSNRALLRSSAGAMEVHQYSGTGAYLGRSAYFGPSGVLNLLRGAQGTGGGGVALFGAGSSNTEGWFADFNNLPRRAGSFSLIAPSSLGTGPATAPLNAPDAGFGVWTCLQIGDHISGGDGAGGRFGMLTQLAISDSGPGTAPTLAIRHGNSQGFDTPWQIVGTRVLASGPLFRAIRHQDGTIEQWGFQGSGVHSDAVPFPVAFPAGVQFVTATINNGTNASVEAVSVVNADRFGFIGRQLGVAGAVGSGFFWHAIGR